MRFLEMPYIETPAITIDNVDEYVTK